MIKKTVASFYSHDHDQLDEYMKRFQGLKRTDYSEAKENFKKFKFGLQKHIAWEEEILFPVLERCGMDEHPDNLKEEHKRFRSILSDTMEILKGPASGKEELVTKKMIEFKDKFIPDISNHMFRETYIFYPAALEFIANKDEWENIKEGFDRIK